MDRPARGEEINLQTALRSFPVALDHAARDHQRVACAAGGKEEAAELAAPVAEALPHVLVEPPLGVPFPIRTDQQGERICGFRGDVLAHRSQREDGARSQAEVRQVRLLRIAEHPGDPGPVREGGRHGGAPGARSRLHGHQEIVTQQEGVVRGPQGGIGRVTGRPLREASSKSVYRKGSNR